MRFLCFLAAVVAALTEDALDALLAKLKVAVTSGDTEAADSLSQQLREEAQAKRPSSVLRRGRGKSEGLLAKDTTSNTLFAGQNASSHLCLFDDVLFSMTPQAKQEFAAELHSPNMVEAVQWVRTGGWWNCGFYGQSCQCTGFARMLSYDRTKYSKEIDARAFGGSVKCDIASWGGQDPAPAEGKHCECRYPGVGDGSSFDSYHLIKRMSSTSYTQEAWVYLLRLTARLFKMPLGTGDRMFHGMENWSARRVSEAGGVLERYWIDEYIKNVALHHAPGPNCLEWGTPTTPGHGFHYANMAKQCTYKWDMQYDHVHYGNQGMHSSSNIIYADVLNLPKVAPVKMNTIFATQVFEHLDEPFEGAKALFDALAPGGCMIYTAPQQAQYHKVPGDYYRYTKEGVKHMLVKQGFCVPDWGFAGGGDFVFDIGRDAGLQIQDFPLEEANGAFNVGYDKVSDSAITIHALAFKPPHASCNAR
mmetsp:Transcript_3173/g.7143  ORF Transcript_3173/g.7143 Transcript_3173/m.7143 type:complete len:475 (-) Transcript_3173:315-1739(-)